MAEEFTSLPQQTERDATVLPSRPLPPYLLPGCTPPPPPPDSREVTGYGFFPFTQRTVPQCFCYSDHLNMHIHFKMVDGSDGLNSLLEVEPSNTRLLMSEVPTLIIGMDVCRDVDPSLATVVHSRRWPQISQYRGYVQTQSPEVEVIDSLHKPVSASDGIVRDSGIMWEILKDFRDSSGEMMPEQIIIFRYGVNESDLNRVLKAELEEIVKACKLFDEKWSPKFLVIKIFEHGADEKVSYATIKNDKVLDDFSDYVRERAGMINTTMPKQYHVLYKQVELSDDNLQELLDSLSYMHQLRTASILRVASQWCGAKTTESEEPAAKRMKTEIDLDKVDLRRERESIDDGEELAVYVLGQLNADMDAKYKFEQYLYYQHGYFGTEISNGRLWQHVSMYAEEPNGGKKIIFAELRYSTSDKKYESIVHSVLDRSDPSGIAYGCGMCEPKRRGPNPSPHPADGSRYVVGHWAYDPRCRMFLGVIPGPPPK